MVRVAIGSRLVRQLLHTGHYAAPPKRYTVLHPGVHIRYIVLHIGVHVLVSFFASNKLLDPDTQTAFIPKTLVVWNTSCGYNKLLISPRRRKETHHCTFVDIAVGSANHELIDYMTNARDKSLHKKTECQQELFNICYIKPEPL